MNGGTRLRRHLVQRPKAATRNRARRAFFRTRAVREAYFGIRRLRSRESLPDLAHLAVFEEIARGPLMRDEALFLHGLIRVVRPKTVVEIGFFQGHSALNFLTALDADARLYSFDLDPACEQRAQALFAHDARLTFRTRSQDEISAADVEHRRVDFVFLDASHDFDRNQRTFARLEPLLADGAILAVHDTGTMPGRLMPDWHWFHQMPERWVGEDCEVMPGERAFVNWLLERHPGFSQIHFHSLHTLRCGITLLQRSGPLARPQPAGG